MLQYNNVSGSLVFDGQDQRDYLARNRSNFLVEPAITLRGGFENIKLQLQYGHSLNLNNQSFRMDDDFMTVGILFSVK